MNSCILMAQIVQQPQLRYTSDNVPITEMLVQFSGLRPDDPPANLKVVGWGNMAQEIQQNYHQGDRVILEGRLGMITVERPEGFKEKRAELVVQRIQSLGAGVSISTPVTASGNTTTNAPSSCTPPPQQKAAPNPSPAYTSATTAPTPAPVPQHDFPEPVATTPSYERKSYPPVPSPEEDIDDIPF
jgi:single-stranded DNA-binding protein